MAAWPAVPSSPLIGSLQIELDDNVERFMGEAGIPLLRPKYTAVSQKISFSVLMTAAEWDTFYAWWKTTLKFGSLPFDLTDFTMTTPVTKVFYFMSAPAREPRVNNNLKWIVSVSLVREAE